MDNQKLKILASIDRPFEAQALIDSGADELYCGLFTGGEKDSHGNQGLNRRGGLFFNLHSIDELKIVADITFKNRIPLHLAVNEFYSEYVLHEVEQQVISAFALDINSFIVADLGLILFIKDKMPSANIIISIGGTTFNVETIKFYSSVGVNKVVLDRGLTIKEIGNISNKSVLPIEVIILNDKCPFVDGFCNFMHNLPVQGMIAALNNPKNFNVLNKIFPKIPSFLKNKIGKRYRGCELDYSVMNKSKKTYNSTKTFKRNSSLSIRNPFFLESCGACNIYDLYNNGIRHFKIAGRGKTFDKKKKDIILLNYARNLLEKNLLREDFYLNVQHFREKIFGIKCKPPTQCYYH